MRDDILRRVVDASAPPPKVVVQGATGRAARMHIRLMRGHGTPIVAGVSPGKSGEDEGLAIFPDCASAVAATGAEASIVMVPPLSVLPAILDALAAGLKLVVTVTEGMPVHDAVHARRAVEKAGAVWIGASTPGLAVPGRIKLGFLPDVALAPGSVAIWSKSGTLSYETGRRLVQRGLGQSAWIGVGGDPVKGARFPDLAPMFRDHAATRAIVIIGEIGGEEEEDLAEALLRKPIGKPVFAILAGSEAPEGVTMGHAGAIVSGGRGTLASKTTALRGAGVRVFDAIGPLVEAVATDLKGQA
ncbi:MAG: succinate--CoA ligase subunit alpha [Salinarimonadaceae bacterium]|nr:MAG: succinate--CoA ligase subunit alpha [Salinarimonadaceae bacterium]